MTCKGDQRGGRKLTEGRFFVSFIDGRLNDVTGGWVPRYGD